MFKIKITQKEETITNTVDIGLQFQRRHEDIIRTLTVKSARSSLVGHSDLEEFMDDHHSYWSRGYLLKQFRNKKFICLGYKN